MENQKIGNFISELRKSKQMTQKDLAAKLNITDKAVSKWERGLSYPDITLLSPLAEVLGVTTSELLNGERNSSVSCDVERSIDSALQYADKNVKNTIRNWHSISVLIFSSLLFVGMLVCIICDMALNGTFTWSLFPISSIVFTWLFLFPVIKWGRSGIRISMIILTVTIIPFLYILNCLISSSVIFMTIGIWVSVIVLSFLWGLYVIFTVWKNRMVLATAITLFIAIPTYLLINFVVSYILSQPTMDVWDVLGISIMALIAIILLCISRSKEIQNPRKGDKGAEEL